MQTILKGDIQITDNIGFVREMMYSNVPNIKIISLDEDGKLPLDHPNVLGGLSLLPPMDALIAEADGDEQSFDIIYFNHFTDPMVEQFVVALIAYLFSIGGHLIMYSPDINSLITNKLIQMFWKRYGIGIGVIGFSECTYDDSCIPIWLGFLYSIHNIGPIEMLYLYPNEALISQSIMDQLLIELSPFGETYQDKINFILDLRIKVKENPKVKIPIYQLTE